jgi:hypothetical protein
MEAHRLNHSRGVCCSPFRNSRKGSDGDRNKSIAFSLRLHPLRTLMATQNGASVKFSHLSTTFSDQDSSYVRTPPDFLTVIFDLDPYAWAGKGGKEVGLDALQRAAEDVCIFLNAHTALRHDNACAVYAAGRSRG